MWYDSVQLMIFKFFLRETFYRKKYKIACILLNFFVIYNM